MIELSWKEKADCEYIQLMTVSQLLAWLTTTLNEEKERHCIKLSGYMVLCEEDGKISILLITNGESQKQLLKILQQPPNEYKEKYIACVLSEEPQPVQEKTEEDQDEQNSKCTEEIDET